MTTSRCRLLAHAVTPTTYRCPGKPVTFHYHAYDPREPWSPFVGTRLCPHSHKTLDAANRCVETNPAVGPIRTPRG